MSAELRKPQGVLNGIPTSPHLNPSIHTQSSQQIAAEKWLPMNWLLHTPKGEGCNQ